MQKWIVTVKNDLGHVIGVLYFDDEGEALDYCEAVDKNYNNTNTTELDFEF